MTKKVWFLCIIMTMVISGTALAAGDADEKTAVMLTTVDVIDWDPAILGSMEAYMLGQSYERLVKFNKPGATPEVLPWLATSWEQAADKMSWTFKLRKGVKFHDGEPFNAKAVKVSIERTQKLGKGVAFIWAPVEEVKIIDDYTVQIMLSYPAAMDLVCGAVYGAIIYSPKAAKKGTDWFMEGRSAGTGPYKVDRYVKSQQVVLGKFDDYWGGWDGKHFDRVIVKIIEEPSTQIQMLKSGDADLTTLVPRDVVSGLKDAKGVEIISRPGWSTQMIYINTQKFPTDNLKIRQAICYAFDYEAAVNSINDGYAQFASGPIPSTIWGANPNLKKYSFDLEKASKLVAESGIPKGKLKLRFDYSSGQNAYDQYAQMLQATLGQIGIEVELKKAPWPSIWPLAKKLDTAPNLLMNFWWPVYPTPNDWLWTLFRTEETPLWNLGHYSNPDFDKLVDQAAGEEGIDRAKAAETYKKAQEMLVDQAVALFAVELKDVIVKRTSVKGYEHNPAYQFPWFYDMYRE
jgi:peptide/nickel transport system substrate-binding protein